ncbi:MAG: LytTR family DNA-binding domain-containing protein [Bacteroidota bacterium]
MNCIVIDDEELSRKSIEHCIKQSDFLNLKMSFDSPIKALSYLQTNKIDLIFLDIEMPEMTGIEFIKTLKINVPQIILATSHPEFALEAFEYTVTDYLIKPLTFSRFFKSVSKAKEIFDNQQSFSAESDDFFIKKGTSIIRINKSEILWVEASGDYAILNTRKEKFMVHSTMKSIEDKLPMKDYLRVHRSYIVRIDKIDCIEDDAISYDKKLIPIGKTYKEEVYKRLNLLT